MKIQLNVNNPWMIATVISVLVMGVLIVVLLQLRAENQALKNLPPNSTHPFSQLSSPWFSQPSGLSDLWELLQSFNDPQASSQQQSLFDRWLGQSAISYLFNKTQVGLSPTINVDETDKAYIVTVNMPQGETVELNTNISGRVLTVSGKVINTSSGKQTQLRSSRQFSQTLNLSNPVDEAKMTTEQDDQSITITLPKLIV